MATGQWSPRFHFYPAEAHHQNYFNTNPEQYYCQRVIKPKLDAFLAAFA